MASSLKGSVVLVLGASSGIGRAAAKLFAEEGAHVIASARRADRLEALKADLSRQGHEIGIAVGDAGKVDDMNRIAGETEARYQKIDVVVYASGTNTPDRSLQRLTPEIWNELISVNLNGAYYSTQAVLPLMRKAKKGHLIYVSSISGVVPDVSGAAYQASKRGLLGLAHAVRVEEKEHGIRTCVVCPGLVDTEILEKRPVKPSAETLAQALQPEDVAELIVSVAKLHPRAAVPEVQILPTTL